MHDGVMEWYAILVLNASLHHSIMHYFSLYYVERGVEGNEQMSLVQRLAESCTRIGAFGWLCS